MDDRARHIGFVTLLENHKDIYSQKAHFYKTGKTKSTSTGLIQS